jgi:diaminohydroxyphosphoribosylaminopyrimidine deaminase/5-amino-6-(5-phosphoribosylamino)uracil reductase
MRRRADAIMVGAGTVRADDPSLLPRPDEGRRPFRVIMGDNVPDNAKVLTDEASDRTVIYDGNLAATMRDLAEEHGVMHVLCEGGGTLAASLVKEGLVDEFAFFIAPKLLGSDGLPNFNKSGGLMADMTNLTFQTIERVGDDILIKAKLEE